MYMNIIYSHTLREVDRNIKYCIVLYLSETMACRAIWPPPLMEYPERYKKNEEVCKTECALY